MAKDYGVLSEAMSKMPEKYKPKVTIHAHVDGYSGSNDNTFHKAEVKRLRQDLSTLNTEISGFDHHKAGEKVLSALIREKAMKTARLMECEALMDEPEKKSSKFDEDEAGEK